MMRLCLFAFVFAVLLLLSIDMFFFFNDTATTEIYTLSLHDALPISLDLSNQHTKFRHPTLPRCRAALPQSFENSAKGVPQRTFVIGSKIESVLKPPHIVAN